MYFILSKTVGILLLPINLILLVGFLALLLLQTAKRKQFGMRLLVGCWLLLILMAVSPLGYALLLPLENRFPRWSGTAEPQGIIVLGGGLQSDVSADRNEPVSGFGVDRIIYAAKLAREFQ